LRSPPIGNGL